jgi:hypothetical protein
MKADHQQFLCLIGRYRLAQVERDIARNPDASRVDRDLATARFQRLSDSLFDQMVAMSEAGTLGRIGLMLARRAP